MDLKRFGKLNLARGLRVQPGSDPLSTRDLRVAFTGAGGKSTALLQLARQLPPPVILSASTHLASSQLALADHHYSIRTPEELLDLGSQLFTGVVLITGPGDGAGRTTGLDPSVMERLHLIAESGGVPLLIEADGSRRLPLKAPAEHEPVIPPFTNLVVVVAGMSGIGAVLEGDSIHRPERFAILSGLKPGQRVDDQAVMKVLLHPSGGLKGIPTGARRSVLLNQADEPVKVDQANQMAGELLSGYSSILVASLGGVVPLIHAVHEKTAAIILAAGGSSRLGTPKQLLEWKGSPFIRHIVGTAQKSGLVPVIVVTGANAPEVEAALNGVDVQLVHNPDWRSGQSTSVRVGLRAVPPDTGSSIFLLSDQPQIPGTLLRELIRIHSRSLAPIVAPRVGGRRANPVLFDRSVFHELLQLQGDTGGRVLFSDPERYTVAWIDWEDPNLLLDVDTPQDYQQLLNMEPKA